MGLPEPEPVPDLQFISHDAHTSKFVRSHVMKRYHWEKRAKKLDQLEQAVISTHSVPPSATKTPSRNGVVVRWNGEESHEGQKYKSKQGHNRKKVAKSKTSAQRQTDCLTSCHPLSKLDKEPCGGAVRERCNCAFVLEESDNAARKSMELMKRVQGDIRSSMPTNETEKVEMELSEILDGCTCHSFLLILAFWNQ